MEALGADQYRDSLQTGKVKARLPDGRLSSRPEVKGSEDIPAHRSEVGSLCNDRNRFPPTRRLFFVDVKNDGQAEATLVQRCAEALTCSPTNDCIHLGRESS